MEDDRGREDGDGLRLEGEGWRRFLREIWNLEGCRVSERRGLHGRWSERICLHRRWSESRKGSPLLSPYISSHYLQSGSYKNASLQERCTVGEWWHCQLNRIFGRWLLTEPCLLTGPKIILIFDKGQGIILMMIDIKFKSNSIELAMMIVRGCLVGIIKAWNRNRNGWLPFQLFGWGKSHSDFHSREKWEWSIHFIMESRLIPTELKLIPVEWD